MQPIPHRHHAAGRRQIRRRLDRPVTAPTPDPVFTASNIPSEGATRTRAISCGGLGAIPRLVRQLGLAEASDQRLPWLRSHLPDHQSDHVLNFASDAWCHGTGPDDIELRRHDAVALDAPGADGIPDPTTAGDFGRRFTAEDVEALQDLADQARLKVGRPPPPDFLAEALLDGDGTPVATGARGQPGVDIAGDGTRGDHPVLIAPANTGAVLRLVNRPGNRPAHEGAAEPLDRTIRLGREAGSRRIDLRGDTDFTRTQRLDAWDAEGLWSLVGSDAMPDLKALAAGLPASDGVEWRRPPQSPARGEPRRRPERVQDRIVRQRGLATWTRLREDVAEVSYRPTACRESYRRIIVRPTIAVASGRARLFDESRGRFSLANDREGTRREWVFQANDRWDREDRIAPLKGGAPAARAAVDDLVSQWASRVMTALAWDRTAWLAWSVPGHPRPEPTPRQQRRRVRMESQRFVNARVLRPCPLVPGGPRRVDRRRSWTEWQGVLLRVVNALRCGGDGRSKPGSGRPGPRGHREPRGRSGGHEEGAEPVATRRRPASPRMVRPQARGADSSSAGSEPRLIKG